jgi:hypothetical protein
MKFVGQYIVVPLIGILVGIPVIGYLAPYIINHGVSKIDLRPKLPAKERVVQRLSLCTQMEMVKGDATEQGMKYVLAATINREKYLKKFGQTRNACAEFTGYNLYFTPDEPPSYPIWWIKRRPEFVNKVQGTAGSEMPDRIALANKLWDEYQEKGDAFFVEPAHPGLLCVEVIYPPLEDKWVRPPSSSLESMQTKMRLVYESPGSKYFCRRTPR